MKRTASLSPLAMVPTRPVLAALLLAVPGFGGCGRPAPDTKAGTNGTAPRADARAVAAPRNELVVGFLPVT